MFFVFSLFSGRRKAVAGFHAICTEPCRVCLFEDRDVRFFDGVCGLFFSFLFEAVLQEAVWANRFAAVLGGFRFSGK